ncbi:MAG: metalloregulator ArsR/SmtB family transcription factor [Actinobacteria bacterium]|nr:metalloregulator ArsR/SmtB family transcription factor [Actinomycetota bacterium]
MRLIRNPKDLSRGKVVLDVSPAYDFLLSLYAVANRGAAELAGTGLAEYRAGLSAAVRGRARRFFGEAWPFGLGFCSVIPGMRESGDIPAFLEFLESMRGEELISLGLHEASRAALPLDGSGRSTSSPGAPGRDNASPGSQEHEEARVVRADPVGARTDFLGLLKRHWAQFFSEKAGEVRSVLTPAALDVKHKLETRPAETVLEEVAGLSLYEDIRWKRVVLAPSLFVAPYLLVQEIAQSEELLVVYDGRIKEESPSVRESVERTAEFYRALGDETRLRVVDMLAGRPMFGLELAKALGISPATVSHHLSKLRSAGIVRSEKRDNLVYFCLNSDRFQEMSMALLRRAN